MTRQRFELIGVKKRFGPKVVLDGVDLTIDKQSSLVIIGGSGTGKSVTIKSILGIIRPDEGTILVDGEDVTHMSGAARDRVLRKFGMLFQGAALFDSLPVWENVAFGLIQGRGVARAKARDIAIQKLAKVGLTEDVAFLSPVGTVRRHAEARRPGPRHRRRSGDHLLRRADHGPRSRSWPTSSTT